MARRLWMGAAVFGSAIVAGVAVAWLGTPADAIAAGAAVASTAVAVVTLRWSGDE